MKRLFIIAFLSFMSTNVIGQSDKKIQKEFIEIAFLSNGDIIADGNKTTVKALKPKLEMLKKNKGKVHYYQAPQIKQTHLMKNLSLIKLIKSYDLRMIAYADKSFSKIKGQ